MQAPSLSTADLQNTNFKYKDSPFARAIRKSKYHGKRERAAGSGTDRKGAVFSATFGSSTDGLWRPLAMPNLI